MKNTHWEELNKKESKEKKRKEKLKKKYKKKKLEDRLILTNGSDTMKKHLRCK